MRIEPLVCTRTFALLVFLGALSPVHSPQAAVCDADADGDVDRWDILRITGLRGTRPENRDSPLDFDGNGVISARDARRCKRRCTFPGCDGLPLANAKQCDADGDQDVDRRDISSLLIAGHFLRSTPRRGRGRAPVTGFYSDNIVTDARLCKKKCTINNCIAPKPPPEFEPFDPETDWPERPPQGPTDFQPERCLPSVALNENAQSEEDLLIPRDAPGRCLEPPRYCRVINGEFVEVSEEEATVAGCEAFATTVCPPFLSDGQPPAKCDDEPADANCDTVTICPGTGDVPENPQQTADPDFPALPPLTPPPPPTPNPNILVDGTRFVPPCNWRDFQRLADSGIIDPVPVTPYNFAGGGQGDICFIDFDCKSDNCTNNGSCGPAGQKGTNDKRFQFSKGNERWKIRAEGGLNLADARLQGLFYPSIAYRANAGADFDFEVTAAGNSREVFHIDGAVSLSNCSHQHRYVLRILGNDEDFSGFTLGGGGVFIATNNIDSPQVSADPQQDPVVAQCRSDFDTLRAQEEITNQALWDAVLAVMLHNIYGPDQGRTIANPQDAQNFINTYQNQVTNYQAAVNAYGQSQPLASDHAFALGIADLDVGLSWAAVRQEHHIGPFVMGTEIDVVGKLGIQVGLKSKTDWLAPDNAPVIDPEVAAGIQATPHASVWGYASVYGGVDIFLASVTAGIQGELEFAGLYLPMVVDVGVDRALVNIDQGAMAGCLNVPFLPNCLPIPGGLQPAVQPTGAHWRLPWGWNVGAEGRFLDGEITAFIRAKVLGIKKQWKKTLASWDGIDKRFFEIDQILPDCPGGSVPGNACDAVPVTGCCLNSGDALACNDQNNRIETADTFGAFCGGKLFDVAPQVLTFNLPVLGNSVTLPIGEQRNMVYLPTFANVLNAPPNDLPLDPLGQTVNDTLALQGHWIPGNGGFCGIPVP